MKETGKSDLIRVSFFEGKPIRKIMNEGSIVRFKNCIR